ncbi:unnamed protein product [Paramecium sonneborni]|uniref:Uncharacterized protein n=1 Tax=Paramecium sonneborni TaxID=65129 RepID=A0A8S1R9B4_9CILI|nr:unnamed protein product [Paramecium sonneborni]
MIDHNKQEETQQYQGFILDLMVGRLVNIEFQIILTSDNKALYIKDGAVIRVDQLHSTQKQAEVLKNLEQIQHLQLDGQFGENNQKIGRWSTIWKGETLKNVGGQYSNDGKKNGQWKELIRNFWSEAQVYEMGEYENNYKKGVWKSINCEKEIGYGEYNKQGQRIGIWIELSDRFWNYSQITYKGEYLNDKKIGKWDIYFKKTFQDYQNDEIGGGLYDDDQQKEGVDVKIGKWIELSDWFWYLSQVTYHGEYKNDKKVGRWNTMWKKAYGDYMNEQIGGGQYDQGNQYGDTSIKIGEWIELTDSFWGDSQVIYKGEYQNGKKIGKWEILWRMYDKKPFQLIGGGQYDEDEKNERESVKTGNWIELNNGFYNRSQVIYNGEYKNGKKVGRWNILWREEDSDQQFQVIGGGSYDDQIGSLKIGKWIELSDGFMDNSQVIYIGEYQNGNKIGFWDINWIYNGINQQIGGGLYDDGKEGRLGLKIGKWVELSYDYREGSQITYTGEYQNGKKIGIWDCYWIQNESNQKIGGGSYDHDCQKQGGERVKNGKWVEISEKFNKWSQIIYDGEYKYGKKIGIWNKINLKEDSIIDELKYDN